MSPLNWINLRTGGLFGGGNRRGGGGRDRLEDISWTVVMIGVFTFLTVVWSWVRAWTRRTLEKTAERVVDVQGDDDDDDLEDSFPGHADSETAQNMPPADSATRKTQ